MNISLRLLVALLLGLLIVPATLAASPPPSIVANVGQLNGDPCSIQAHVYTPISITGATTTKILTPTTGKKIYICHLFLFTAIANNVGIVEGVTGGTCTSSTVGVIGGTTSTNGINFTANQGFESGNGTNFIAQTASVSNDLCFITSAAGPLAGAMVTVQQ